MSRVGAARVGGNDEVRFDAERDERTRRRVAGDHEHAVEDRRQVVDVAIERRPGGDDDRGNAAHERVEDRDVRFAREPRRVGQRLQQVAAGRGATRALVGAGLERETRDHVPRAGDLARVRIRSSAG